MDHPPLAGAERISSGADESMTGIWRTGWRNTLFGSDDMSVKTWRSWLSEHGSVGGSLWTWFGLADNGEEFAIPGIEVSRFNDEGLLTEVVMFYPFENEEVHRRVREGNWRTILVHCGARYAPRNASESRSTGCHRSGQSAQGVRIGCIQPIRILALGSGSVTLRGCHNQLLRR